MKIYFILTTALFLLLSCKSKPVPEQEDDFLKVPTYVKDSTNTPTSVPVDNSVEEVLDTVYVGNSSYWFVYGCDSDGEMERNGFIMQNHSWFSYDEAKKNFSDESKKNFFIKNIVRIDRETYLFNK